MGSSYQSLREGLEAALRHTRPTDTQDSDFEASKLPPFLQELLDRYPPNFGDETPEAGTDDSNTAENDSIAEESSSALSQACGTESDHDSIASTSSDSNELSSVEIEAFIDYYVAEKFRKVRDRTSTNSDATEPSAMTEHNDEQTFQLKAEKSALEDRLNNLRMTVHGSIVSETGATASATKKQCQCLDETIKHICRINGLLGIAQDEKTNNPMLQLPKSNQEAETHETNSRDRCSSVNAKSWGEIQKDQVSDCALLKVLLSKDVNFLNELSFFGSGRSMHPLRRELDTALNDMREGNAAARQAQDFDHLTMTSFAELFIAWLWCIEVPIGGFLPEKISSTIYLKEAAPLIVARFLRDVKSEVGHSLSYAHQLISGSNHLVSLSGAPILLDGSHQDILRPHQLSGVRFLWREIVKEKKPGGALLAHEMGLGKTLQIVAFLSVLAAAGSSDDPLVRDQVPEPLKVSRTLVLCPAALSDNWMREFQNWRPVRDFLGPVQRISSATLQGDRFQYMNRWYNEGGILLMSYELFRAMLESREGENLTFLERSQVTALNKWLLRGPTLVIADEAHRLQSENSQTSRACFRFSTARRIALTGSPLSNTLEEYYRIFEWISPGRLGGMESFKTEFIKPIERGSDSQSTSGEQKEALIRMSILNELLNRKIDRVGISVLKGSLPPKHEFRVMLKLSSTQRKAYNLIVGGLRKGASGGVSTPFWTWLDTLQLCCNHPSLLKKRLQQSHTLPISEDDHEDTLENSPSSSQQTKEVVMAQSIFRGVEQLFQQVADVDDPEQSPRVMSLIKIVDESSKLGDKTLVFSHSIPTIRYLETVLTKRNTSFLTLTGEVSVQERQNLIDQFNSTGPEMVFLISTRAGGVGLNIQAANRVVIFDFTFNPTWETQAIGRAYRIGQTKPVFVYRLITGATFEETLFKKVLFKTGLATCVVDKRSGQRLGTKDTMSYLKDVVETKEPAELNEDASRLDPDVIASLQARANLPSIHGIHIVEDRPEELGLTPADWAYVWDEVRAHRLRHAGGAQGAMA